MGMEILIAAMVSLMGQIIKPAVQKWGSPAVLVLVFVLTFLGTAGFKLLGIIDTPFYKELIPVFMASIAIYEVILKRIGLFVKPKK